MSKGASFEPPARAPLQLNTQDLTQFRPRPKIFAHKCPINHFQRQGEVAISPFLPPISSGKLVDFLWSSVSQRGVWTPRVIQIDGLINGQARAGLSLKFLAQGIFALKNSIHPLSQRILRAVIALRHADPQPPSCQQFNIFMTAVLRASIGMMNRPGPLWQIYQSLL